MSSRRYRYGFAVKDGAAVIPPLNLASFDACKRVFTQLYMEIEQRHGVAKAQDLVAQVAYPKRTANDQRNIELMVRFVRSGLSLEKFAEELAADNRRLLQQAALGRAELARVKHPKHPPDGFTRTWSSEEADRLVAASTADQERRFRGPGGSPNAQTIIRQLRRLRKEMATDERFLSGVRLALHKADPDTRFDDLLEGTIPSKMSGQ